MNQRKIRKYLHTTLTGVMAIWLSGIVFLFCCHSAAASPVDSCPMAKMSAHCDKAKKQNANSPYVESSPVDCIECGFLPVVFDKSRRVEPAQKQIAPAAEQLAVRYDPLVFVKIPAENHTVYKRVPVTDRVFIKNCVFRI